MQKRDRRKERDHTSKQKTSNKNLGVKKKHK